MRIRPAHLLLCGLLFASPVAACSSSSKSSTTTTTSANSSTTASTASASGAGASSDVVKYCNDVVAFVKKAEPYVTAKDRAGIVALQSDAQTLGQEGAAVAAAMSKESQAQLVADQARLSDCEAQASAEAKKFATALGG